MQHLKKEHGLDVFISQRLKERSQGSANSEVPKSSIRDQVRAQQRFMDVNQKILVTRKRIEERAKNRAALTWDVLPCKAQKDMKKDTFIMEFVVNHMKMVDQKEEAMRKEINIHVEESYESRVSSMVIDANFTVLYFCDKDKSSEGSDDGGDEDDGSSQDGGGDDDFNDGSNDDADDDDGGSNVSGGGDNKADGEDDGTVDEDYNGGSDEGDTEGVSEQDDAQDVSTDEDE
ncbi:hypothetical protein L7F22_058860, partial [Adiantum nelumboides]|nr:hypothetical protein [Adiantum nelumboides]